MGEAKFWIALVGFSFIGILYLFQFIIRRKDDRKHGKNVDYLLKMGKRIEIDLMKSIVDIQEFEFEKERKVSKTFSESLDDGLLLGGDKKIISEKEYLSVITLQFLDNGRPYFHQIRLKKPAETVRKLFIFQKKTTLIYDLANPENCIVDLDFAN